MKWWPFSRRETRQQATDSSGGDYADQVIRAAERAVSGGGATDPASTAALETAALMWSRGLVAAKVVAEPWAQKAVSPAYRAQLGRDLVRRGSSLHLIDVRGRDVRLLPAATWHWVDGHDPHPSTWMVRATTYGPSSSVTQVLPAAAVVFCVWGSSPGATYLGSPPSSWASSTASLLAEVERSMRDEAAGPVASILPVPSEWGPDDEEDPLQELRADISAARGKAVLPETTRGAGGAGPAGQPAHDWRASRLGPAPTESMTLIQRRVYSHVLSSAGVPPAMVSEDAAGTGQREAYRQWSEIHLQPMGELIASELSEKLETSIEFDFSGLHAHDLQGRATSFKALVTGGMEVDKALAISGLMGDTE